MNRYFLIAAIGLLFSGGIVGAEDNSSGIIAPEDDYYCHLNPDDGHHYCVCDSEFACELMADEEVCEREVVDDDGTVFTMNDTECWDNSPASAHTCACRSEIGARPGASRRPDALNTPTENAPVSRPRPRRAGDRFEQVPDGTSNTLSPTERENETVSARRGNAPSTDIATEDEADEEAPRRQVRDHRR